MPVESCGDGTYRIGSGPCQYDSREKAERAYQGYLASEGVSKHQGGDDLAHRDNLASVDGIHHRTGGRWRKGEVAKAGWAPVQRYRLKLPEGSKSNPLGKIMERAGMDGDAQTALIERVTNMGLPAREIELSPRADLYASQARVHVGKVGRIPLTGAPPILLKLGDRTIIIDGHHRIAKARARSVTIPVVVYEADLLNLKR